MKKIIFSLILVLTPFAGVFLPLTSVEARTVRVKSYFKPSTGRYVMPSYRTSPNRVKIDNWSTKGNYNPYTGKIGTKSYFGW